MPKSSAVNVSRRDIEVRLRCVADPCSLRAQRPLDVLSMGLINKLNISDGHVRMSLVLTDPTCLFGGEIIDAIEKAVSSIKGVESVTVDIDIEDIWTPDRLSPQAARTFWPQMPSRHLTTSRKGAA